MTLFGFLHGEQNPPAEVVAQRNSLHSQLQRFRPESIPVYNNEPLELEWVKVPNPENISEAAPSLDIRPAVLYSDAGCEMFLHGKDQTQVVHPLGRICFSGENPDAGRASPVIEILPFSDRSWQSCNVPPFLTVALAALEAQPPR
ncbi:MAG TPA: hypothetical protein VK674_04105 [Candidatus Limnocylindria bacterium]|nr:hypothetical protein [Candidatus Limnocylindria bacterium]